jgi:CheY-like chemotaxis protein
MKLAKTILLVEDAIDYREILQDLLADSFEQILAADHGEHALRTLNDHHIDLILCDVNMPEMPGDQFL